jgi:hypothetical protein
VPGNDKSFSRKWKTTAIFSIHAQGVYSIGIALEIQEGFHRFGKNVDELTDIGGPVASKPCIAFANSVMPGLLVRDFLCNVGTYKIRYLALNVASPKSHVQKQIRI